LLTGLLVNVWPRSHDAASVMFASVRPVPHTSAPKPVATSLSPPPTIVGLPTPPGPEAKTHVFPSSSEYQKRSPFSQGAAHGNERLFTPIPVGAAIQIR
jgi:hypothetical protein